MIAHLSQFSRDDAMPGKVLSCYHINRTPLRLKVPQVVLVYLRSYSQEGMLGDRQRYKLQMICVLNVGVCVSLKHISIFLI